MYSYLVYLPQLLLDEAMPVKETKLIKQLREVANENVEMFFFDKEWFCGGPIPQRQLHGTSSLDVIIGTEFCVGMTLIYSMLDRVPQLQEHHRDIKYVIKLLSEVKQRNVPKDFQTGIIILYLHFCKGLPMPKKHFDVTHLSKWAEEM